MDVNSKSSENYSECDSLTITDLKEKCRSLPRWCIQCTKPIDYRKRQKTFRGYTASLTKVLVQSTNTPVDGENLVENDTVTPGITVGTWNLLSDGLFMGKFLTDNGDQ